MVVPALVKVGLRSGPPRGFQSQSPFDAGHCKAWSVEVSNPDPRWVLLNERFCEWGDG